MTAYLSSTTATAATARQLTPSRALSARERGLAVAAALLVLVACVGPDVSHLTPASSHNHAFADQRAWLGIPFAADVLSNLGFAVMGVWGWCLMLSRRSALPLAQRLAGQVFFSGLLITTLCSGFYHWLPSAQSLALDRMGMAVAFAGLLGLACAERVSLRAGRATTWAVLLGAMASIAVWQRSGHVLPWAVVQFGGMALVLTLAALPSARPPAAWVANAPTPTLTIKWGWVIAFYVLAKLLEAADTQVFELTGHLLSGHSLKHLVAALAAWPVCHALAALATPGKHAKLAATNAVTI
jgi:hypothetical protein